MEIDNNATSVVTPEIDQSDEEHIYEATTNSVLIPGGNNIRSTLVANLVDETPLGGGDTIDAAQEYVYLK